MRLYKYVPKKYLTAFFRQGSLKIGTLYEYRNVENYGAVIGDSDEGVRRTELSFKKGNEVDLGGITPEALFLREALQTSRVQSTNKKIVSLVDGHTFAYEEHSEDLFIYCMTSSFDPNVMRQFGCDSCIEITNPIAFFAAISHRIRHKAQFHGLSPVQYGRRARHFTGPHETHPSILKDHTFEYQNEWRAIWKPTKKISQALFIDVPKAIHYCKPYAP